jgi:hypothetical protein
MTPYPGILICPSNLSTLAKVGIGVGAMAVVGGTIAVLAAASGGKKRTSSASVTEAKTQHMYVWQVSLQVTSPDRPNLRHEIQYRVQALSGDRNGAIAKAKEIAKRDGNTVISVTGAARGYRVKG